MNPGQDFPAITSIDVQYEIVVVNTGQILIPVVPNYFLTPPGPIPRFPEYQVPYQPPTGTPGMPLVDAASPSGPPVGSMEAGSGLMPIPSEMTPVVILNINNDPDLDGFDSDLEDECGSDPESGASIPEFITGSFLGTDDDADTFVDEPLLGGSGNSDCDQDNWTGADELHIFGPSSPGDQSPCQHWPGDLVPSNHISIQDVLAIKPYFNQPVPPAMVRYDLVPSNFINIQDVLRLKPVFNTTCVP
jgi:hypothetical protein